MCTCMRVCIQTGRNSEVKKQGARWKKESEGRGSLRWGDRDKEGHVWVFLNVYLAAPDLTLVRSLVATCEI